MKRIVFVCSVILFLTLVSGLLFYPPTKISIPFWKESSIAKPVAPLKLFAAKIFQIPVAVENYNVSISYEPPTDCHGYLYPNSVAEFAMDNGDPRIPYFEQAFATTSCMNVWPRGKGLEQEVNGMHVFCLPEGKSVQFSYPADKSLLLTVPMTDWNNKCSAFDSNGIVDSEKYFYAYASPEIGEIIIGWFGLLLLWVVTTSSVLSIWEWSKIHRKD